MNDNKILKTRRSIELPEIHNYRHSPIKRLTRSEEKTPGPRSKQKSPIEYPMIKQHEKLLSNFLINYLNRKTYKESHIEKCVLIKRPEVKKHQVKMDPAYNYRLAKRIKQRRKKQEEQRHERFLESYEFTMYPFDGYPETGREEKEMA